MTSNLSVEENDTIENNYNSLKVEQILKSIKELKDNYSTILTLSLIEGFDNEEIAKILNINNQLVRTTISRAKAKLRSVLNKKNNKYENR